jgi:hypothetical protein
VTALEADQSRPAPRGLYRKIVDAQEEQCLAEFVEGRELVIGWGHGPEDTQLHGWS